MSEYKPRYSGSNCSGICVCGCPWDNHHMMLVMRQEYVDATHEGYILGECETYGFNEAGGMKYNKEINELEDHCSGYRDSKGEK